MDNDLIQDTNLDLLQVNAVEVEYSGIAPINVDNQEHTISLDPSALSSKLDTSAFDEWTATHSAGTEYSAGEGIDITDHVISYTGDPGDATPWISGNKIITSADTMQPGEFIQVLSSFDLSGNKNHFITVKGQGYYFPTNQDLKERVGVDDYLPLSSFSSYTASIASNLENNWNYTNSAYSQSLNNYYNKLDISAFSSWSSEHSGDYLTKESADTLYQPIGDYLTTADSGNFYPMEGNPSGFLTGVDLSDYYEKNETSSKEEISSALTAIDNTISGLTGEFQEKGDYYSASNPSGFITGVDLSNYYEKNETSSKEEISDALTGKLDTTAFTSYTSNADTTEYTAGDNIDITNHVISGKDWSSEIESATSGVLTANIPSAFHFSANGIYDADFVNINVPGGLIPLISASGHAGGPETITIAASGFDTSSYHGEVHVNENGLLCKQGASTIQYNNSGAINSKFISDYGGGFSAIPTPIDYYTTAVPITKISYTGLTAQSDPTSDYTARATVNLNDVKYEYAGTAWSLRDSVQKREIECDTATSAITAIAGSAIGEAIEYTGIAPIDVNNTTHQISADVWTLSARNGISILEDNVNKITTLDFIGGSGFYPMTGNPSGFLLATDTSSKQQISAALTGKQDNLTIAGSNSVISSINGSALSAGENYSFDRNVFVENSHVYIKNYDDSTFVMTSNLDDTYYNASLHDENITSSSRIKIILNEPVDRLVFRPCNNSYAPTNYGSALQPYYTAFGTAHGNDGMLLTSDLPKTEWYIDIDRINQNTGFYYMQIFPDYNPWVGDYNLSAYIANTGWIDETLATQPWVLSQLTGSTGGGSTISWYTDTPDTHTSADINLVIQTTANIGGRFDRNLLDGNGNFIGALIPSAASEDLGKVLTITAGSPRWQNLPETPSGAYGIKTEVVANSGLATGQNILYIVTGN